MSNYVTLSFVMTTELGRPRDRRIDSAVLCATAELLAETGYAGLSVDAIARRAGTSKPAIYRRWPSKAHLVHEAVFPISDATALPDTGSLAGDIREMVGRTAAVLTTSAARAALPGLVGEMAADLTLHAALLERFGDILSRGLTDRLSDAVERGQARPDVTAAEIVEMVAGTTFLALLTRGDALDNSWVERTAALITRGVSADDDAERSDEEERRR
jgi:AcrR family transcriptional regulator